MKHLKSLLLVALMSIGLSNTAFCPYDGFHDKVKSYNELLNMQVSNTKLGQMMDKMFGMEKYQVYKELETISNKLGIKSEWIIYAIYKESKGNPKAVNLAGSGATGLIQWLPSTAKALGTSTEELKSMSTIQQLPYIEKYLKLTGKIKNISSYEDLYLSIFHPKAVGKCDNYIIASNGTKRYKQNAGVDINKDGLLTVADFKQYARLGLK